MSHSGVTPDQERKQPQTSASTSVTSKSEGTSESRFAPFMQTIQLYDAQTGMPIGVYLENDNTLSLNNVQLVYPNATTVKCILSDQPYPKL
ncbi:unnamed protein product, partial [Didymodactylos carnosus]